MEVLKAVKSAFFVADSMVEMLVSHAALMWADLMDT